MKGPSAEFCVGSTPTGLCNRIGGSIVSTGGKVKIGDNNEVGAGVSVGFGAGGSASLDDGILSLAGEGKFLGGVSISVKLDLNPVISFGEDAFLFAENVGGILMLAAGDGIFGDIVGGGAGILGSAISILPGIAEVAIGDSLAAISFGPNIAMAVFTGVLTGDLSVIFDTIADTITD